MGRPLTMCPRTNVLGPLVYKLIVPCDKMSLDWYIPVISITYIYILYHAYNHRDVSIDRQCVSGMINSVDQGYQKIRTGTNCFGTSHHPTSNNIAFRDDIGTLKYNYCKLRICLHFGTTTPVKFVVAKVQTHTLANIYSHDKRKSPLKSRESVSLFYTDKYLW